jgi:tetratricopeptide (TPR) repeat protein
VLAQSLLELGEHQEALEQFKAAARLRPGFESSSRLATAYLMLSDKSNAAKVLSGIQKAFGDTAVVHVKLGIIYGKTNFYDDAIEEFRIAIAKDDKLAGAHYSLGASYLMRLGEPGYEKAEAEFRKEIAIDPGNSLVYAPLGRIAMTRHRYEEAEADLKHAVALNPQSAGTYLVLGQLYREIGKTSAAIAAFRKAIALTLDPSKNGYEVEQAHFWLGRLLIQSGSTTEGRNEMDVAQNLLYQKGQQMQSGLSGNAPLPAPLDKTHEPDPGDLAAQNAFEKQAGPLIASSYDNLGVNAANAGEFANSASYFAKAAQWNPMLGDVDKNWGRAAFAAKEYAQAVGPLSRTLALHPDNADLRSMTGLSFYMIHDYTQTLRILQPIEASLGVNPLLTIAYAGSMAIAGDYSQGLARLNALENAHPDAAIIHCLLGEAYANKKLYDQSANELLIALKLDPSSAESKSALAFTDLALGRKTEAQQLLSELAEAGSTDGEVYYRLGRLQSELGSARTAVGNLETAIRLDPMNAAYHQELAEAYRRNAQPDEADREARQSETLQAQNEFNHQSGSGKSGSGNQSGGPSKIQKN